MCATATASRPDRQGATGRQLPEIARALLRDNGGNVILIGAAAIFPLLALIGGGIDMGRGYMAQTRLQQACDAGTLAARKRLGVMPSAGEAIPEAVADTGQRFFNINFRQGSYGSLNREFVMTVEEDLTVSGLASATVPTMLMGVFGVGDIAVSAACSAQIDMVNTDVLLVLDTTGSMARTNPGDAMTRIEALRDTVIDFHSRMEASKPAGTRIRYGFLPYSTNVNVGHLLRDDWLVDEWDYNFREPRGGNGNGNGGGNAAPEWRYATIGVDLGFLENGNSTMMAIGGTPDAPVNMPVTYRGCIEERDTYEITDFDNVDLRRAIDLDIDRVPDANDPDTQWRPMLNELSFTREVRTNGRGFLNPGVVNSAEEFVNAWWWGFGACPAAARLPAEMSAQQVSDYVAGLVAQGNTYHDIGMIWAARLMSPSGPFAAHNADADGVSTNRHIIYLTDGETAPLDISYGAYGIEPLDRRRWRPQSSMTLTEVVENRFGFACREAERRNIQIWVIGFGTAANPVMQDCSGADRYFVADQAADLENTFAEIARRIGELRITE